MDRKVVKITGDSFLRLPRRKRVAAYARVSSDKDAMLHSLSQQVSAYSDRIRTNPSWEFAGVYADEAKTGTKETRSEFLRLISDCHAGKVDMIITKSISRFARNTVTLLENIRGLKEIGIDVYFEEQNIHTLSSDGELMLTILASYAQEESRSASENQKWRIRKSYEKGEVMQWRFLYGYKITKDKIEINPEQAAVVREIFNRAIAGESFGSICRDLNARKLYTVFKKKWTTCRITELLSNEKYIGDAILQKEYVNNHIEKKTVKNNGELPMYYAEGTHEAIIDKDTYLKAMDIVRSVKEQYSGKKSTSRYPFTGIIKCGICGKNYKRVSGKGKVYWNCRTFLEKGRNECNAKQIPEEILQSVTAGVLKQRSFDGELLRKQIDRIEVPGANNLVFVFKDGHTEERTWEDRSRSKSWTLEMREAARQRALKAKGE